MDREYWVWTWTWQLGLSCTLLWTRSASSPCFKYPILKQKTAVNEKLKIFHLLMHVKPSKTVNTDPLSKS